MVDRIKASGIGYMNTSTLSRIETGTRPVRLTEAQVIGRILQVGIESMTSEFEDLAYYEAQHGVAREEYVRFKTSVVEVTAAQIRLARYVDHLREMEKTADDALLESIRWTIHNIERFIELDLSWEAAELSAEKRAENERLSDTPAGRFLKHQDG